jgi:hypothetical protein
METIKKKSPYDTGSVNLPSIGFWAEEETQAVWSSPGPLAVLPNWTKRAMTKYGSGSKKNLT